MILYYLRGIYRSLKEKLYLMWIRIRCIGKSLLEKCGPSNYTLESYLEKSDLIDYTDMNVPMTPSPVYAIDKSAQVKPYREDDIYIYVGAGSGQEGDTYISFREIYERWRERDMIDLTILAQQDYISMSDLGILTR